MSDSSSDNDPLHSDDPKEPASSTSSGRRPFWDELLFSAIEKIAQAPSKLKDPKESIQAASDWVKNVRDDIQKKVAGEVSERLSQLDWDALSKRVSEDLADRFEMKVETRIQFVKKAKPESDESNT